MNHELTCLQDDSFIRFISDGSSERVLQRVTYGVIPVAGWVGGIMNRCRICAVSRSLSLFWFCGPAYSPPPGQGMIMKEHNAVGRNQRPLLFISWVPQPTISCQQSHNESFLYVVLRYQRQIFVECDMTWALGSVVRDYRWSVRMWVLVTAINSDRLYLFNIESIPNVCQNQERHK